MNEFLRDIPIADAHHHLWDLDENPHPWLSGQSNKDFFLGDYAALKRNYLPDDYRRDAAGHNVKWTVHIEAEWAREDQLGETRWVAATAAAHGLPDVFVGHAWFNDPNVEKIL
ncbi:MAG: amidohydrolase family protein, partial [Chromatiales bacterium]|nr:amidohydrolase family protein [Chromatiales bacterium]